MHAQTAVPDVLQPSDMLRLYMRVKSKYPDDWKIHHDVISHFVEFASKERWPRDVIASHLPPGYSLRGWIDCLQGKINYPQMRATELN
jgi:hypothetical protein